MKHSLKQKILLGALLLILIISLSSVYMGILEKDGISAKINTSILVLVSLALFSGCILFALITIGKKRTISLLLIFTLTLSLEPVELIQAEATQSNPLDDFEFTDLSDTTCEVKRYIGTAENVFIPEKNGAGKAVVGIGKQAFAGCSSLTSVTILNSVTSIGDEAFNGCSSDLIIYCDSAESAAYGYAHANNISAVLTDTCGDNLTWTLTDAGVLTISGTGPMDDFHYDVINGLYGTTAPWGKQWEISANKIVPTSVVIEYGVTSIGDSAFAFCGNLTSVTIPDSVTSIGDSAFWCCHSLTSVTIGYNVTSIGNYAFRECEALTSVTIPDSVTSIGDSAFWCCHSLTSVTIPNSVTSIGDSAFRECEALTSVTIGNSVTSIGNGVFDSCSNLTSVTIPNSVTSIGFGAFDSCDKLTKIIVASGNNNYCSDNGVLFDKTKAILIRYPAGRSGTYAIPSTVTSIGDKAFSYCRSLTSVTIPDSVTQIGYAAFDSCSNLTSVTIGNSVTSIGGWAFSDCSKLTSVTIPNSVTSIGNYAFWHCRSLTSVTIGYNVTSIGIYTLDPPHHFDENYCIVYDFTIYGFSGSYAEQYANENNFPFVACSMPETDPVNPVATKFTVFHGDEILPNNTLTLNSDALPGHYSTLTVKSNTAWTATLNSDSFVKFISDGTTATYTNSTSANGGTDGTDTTLNLRVAVVNAPAAGQTATAKLTFNVKGETKEYTITQTADQSVNSSVQLTVKNQADGTVINNGDIIKWPVNQSLLAELSASNGNGKFRVNAYTMSQKPTGDDTDRNYKVKVEGTDDEGFWYNNSEYTADYLKQFGNNNAPAVPFQANAGTAGQYVKIWIAAEDENYAQNEGLAQVWFALELVNEPISAFGDIIFNNGSISGSAKYTHDGERKFTVQSASCPIEEIDVLIDNKAVSKRIDGNDIWIVLTEGVHKIKFTKDSTSIEGEFAVYNKECEGQVMVVAQDAAPFLYMPSGSPIKNLPLNTKLSILGKVGEYYYADVPNLRDGFIHKDYVTIPDVNTQLTLTADKTTAEVGEEVTFTVSTSITSGIVSIVADGEYPLGAIDLSTTQRTISWKFSQSGERLIEAKLDGVKAEPITVRIIKEDYYITSPENGSKIDNWYSDGFDVLWEPYPYAKSYKLTITGSAKTKFTDKSNSFTLEHTLTNSSKNLHISGTELQNAIGDTDSDRWWNIRIDLIALCPVTVVDYEKESGEYYARYFYPTLTLLMGKGEKELIIKPLDNIDNPENDQVQDLTPPIALTITAGDRILTNFTNDEYLPYTITIHIQNISPLHQQILSSYLSLPEELAFVDSSETGRILPTTPYLEPGKEYTIEKTVYVRKAITKEIHTQFGVSILSRNSFGITDSKKLNKELIIQPLDNIDNPENDQVQDLTPPIALTIIAGDRILTNFTNDEYLPYTITIHIQNISPLHQQILSGSINLPEELAFVDTNETGAISTPYFEPGKEYTIEKTVYVRKAITKEIHTQFGVSILSRNSTGLTSSKKLNKELIIQPLDKKEITAVSGMFKYAGYINQTTDSSWRYYYSDSYFEKDSLKPNEHLATMSLCLELSSWSSMDAKEWINKTQNAEALLNDIGFEEFAQNDAWKKKPEMHSIGAVAAYKNIDDYTVVALAVRGGGYGEEWGGNFTLGKSGNLEGFEIARDEVYDFLSGYIENHKSSFNPSLKIWIVGYSRGGAVANMVAGELTDDGRIGGFKIPPKNIYAYTFEAPRGYVGLNSDKYNHIHNYINYMDIVPRVGPRVWSFERYNKEKNDIQIIPSLGTIQFPELMEPIIEQFDLLKSGIPPIHGVQTLLDDVKYNPQQYAMEIIDFEYDPDTDEFIITSEDPLYKPFLVIDSTLFALVRNNDYPIDVMIQDNIDFIFTHIPGNRVGFVDSIEKPLSNLAAFFLGSDDEIDWGSVMYDAFLGNNADGARKVLGTFIFPYNSNPQQRIKATAETAAILIADAALKQSGTSLKEKDKEMIVTILDVLFQAYIDNPERLFSFFYFLIADNGFQPHWPEVTFAAMMAHDSYYTGGEFYEEFFPESYRIAYINCPVDIYVYDEDNQLISQIVGDNVTNTLPVHGASITKTGTKQLILPSDAAYNIKIQATDNGEMSVSVLEYDSTLGQHTLLRGYQNIQIHTGESYQVILPEYILDDYIDKDGNGSSTNYRMIGPSGSEIAPSISLNGDSIDYYQISLSSNNQKGIVTGGGRFVSTSFAQVQAQPMPTVEFLGWYSNGKLVSTENPYRFAVNQDAHLMARFSEGSFHKLTVKATKGGNVNFSEIELPEGVKLELIAESEPNYKFVRWETNSGIVDNYESATTYLTMPAKDTIVTAVFTHLGPPSFDDVAIPSDTFTFKKIWEGDSENSIDFTLYKADGSVYHHAFNKKVVSNKEWKYNAWFSSPVACYVIEKPVEGYITRYINVGVYEEINDRCCDGGTIINKKIPKTGDEAPIILWISLILLGVAGLTTGLVIGRKKKSQK